MKKRDRCCKAVFLHSIFLEGEWGGGVVLPWPNSKVTNKEKSEFPLDSDHRYLIKILYFFDSDWNEFACSFLANPKYLFLSWKFPFITGHCDLTKVKMLTKFIYKHYLLFFPKEIAKQNKLQKISPCQKYFANSSILRNIQIRNNRISLVVSHCFICLFVSLQN